MISHVQWWLLFTSQYQKRRQQWQLLPLMTFLVSGIKCTTKAVSGCEKQIQLVLWDSE